MKHQPAARLRALRLAVAALLALGLLPLAGLVWRNGLYYEPALRYVDFGDRVDAVGCAVPSPAWWVCATGADPLLDRRQGPPPVIGLYDAPLDGPHRDLDADLDQADQGWTAWLWRLFGSGHGMALAGLVAGRGGDGVPGVAPGARLIYYSYTRDDGPRTPEAALEYFSARHARIATFAWVGRLDPASLDRFVRLGGLAIGGFPNRNEPSNAPPAASPGVLAVRALGSDGRPEPSGYGPALDLLSPAPASYSAAPHARLGPLVTRPYGGGLCCNSAAVATAAGAAALLAWVDPLLTGPQLHKRLLLSARPVRGQATRWTPETGYGALDVQAAADLDRQPPQITVEWSRESGGGSSGVLEIEVADDVLPMPVDREHDRHLAPLPASAIARVELRRADSERWEPAERLSVPTTDALDPRHYTWRARVPVGPTALPLQVRAVDSSGNEAVVTIASRR